MVHIHFAVLLAMLSKLTIVENIVENACSSWLKTHVRFTQDTHFYNVRVGVIRFESIEQLLVTCRSNTNYTANNTNSTAIKINRLILNPTSKSLMFANNLDMTSLLDEFSFENLKTVEIRSVKGFVLSPGKSTSLPKTRGLFDKVFFLDSFFQFYLNESTSVSGEYCRKEVLAPNAPSFFGLSAEIVFRSSFYTPNLCPYVFMRSDLVSMRFLSIADSLIYKNRLGFLPINETKSFDLGMQNYITLSLQVAYAEINLDLVNRHVFKYVYMLDLIGNSYHIQHDLFSYFKHIKVISLQVDNFETFVHNGLEWTQYLQRNVNASRVGRLKKFEKSLLLKIYEYSTFFVEPYAFPDKDLCLFKEFPHQQLVLPLVYSDRLVECTCTLVWLVQYVYEYLSYLDSSFDLNSINNRNG